MKAEFLTELRAEEIAEGEKVHEYKLLEPFRICSGVLDDCITVPAGFIFDGESIPSVLQWLVPPFGQSRRGACVHDWLYTNGGYFDDGGVFVSVTRSKADSVYKELVLTKGLPSWRANMRWSVLRAVGWVRWNSYRKEN